MKVLGLIPARAGSRGVNNKNLLMLAGKPVIAYTIEETRRSRHIDRIAVTTESADIKRVVAALGVEVIDRPAEYATEDARLDYALRHAVDALGEKDGYAPDVVAFLMANVPLREPGVIDRCVEHLLETGADSVRTFSSIGKYHPQWMVRIDGDRITDYEKVVAYRRQDLEPLYIHDGSVIAVTLAAIRDSVNHLDDNFCFMGADRRGVICGDGTTVEIDTARDVYAAEAALRIRRDMETRDDHC